MIQTTLSYKINPRKWELLVLHHSVMPEAVSMSEQLRTVEDSSASSAVRRGRNFSRRKRELCLLLLGAIDEELKRVFREEGVAVIYSFVESKYELKREMIAEKPEVFSAGLQRLLVSAAPVMEKLILQKLCGRLGLRFVEKEGYEFSDYVRELRERCVDN
jgi:hypothetical protein